VSKKTEILKLKVNPTLEMDNYPENQQAININTNELFVYQNGEWLNLSGGESSTRAKELEKYVSNYIISAVDKLGVLVGSPTGFDSYRSIPPYFEVPHYVNKATTDEGVNLLVDTFNKTVLIFEYVAIQNEKLKNGEMGLNQEEFIAGLPKYKILELNL
jgi:hypothetical protein